MMNNEKENILCRGNLVEIKHNGVELLIIDEGLMLNFDTLWISKINTMDYNYNLEHKENRNADIIRVYDSYKKEKILWERKKEVE